MEYIHGGARVSTMCDSPLMLGYSDQAGLAGPLGPVLCNNKLICWFAGSCNVVMYCGVMLSCIVV